MMRISLKHIAAISAAALTLSLTSAYAQKRETIVRPDEKMMQYIVEGKDTIYIDHIHASKVYSKLPKQKGREWRKYYRLVHNFSKSYPYALVARKLVMEADSTIAADKLRRGKREKYVNKVQKELFEDQHHFRSVYAQKCYLRYARPANEIPREDRCYRRKDLRKRPPLDKKSLRKVSIVLGHGRESVAREFYLGNL